MIVYRARLCRDGSAPEEVRLIALSDEPGFGYETRSGAVLIKGKTMAEATAALLHQYGDAAEVDSNPYWRQSA